MGSTFGGGCDDDCRVFPVPRLIHEAEWVRVEHGLSPRAQELNAFLTDIYGDRQIVSAGVISAQIVTSADHFEPAMRGLPQPGGPAPIIGFDLVRGADGELRVLEDNLRTPSGLAYAAAARRAVETQYPLDVRRCIVHEPSFDS